MTADVWLTLWDGTVCELGGVEYDPRYRFDQMDVSDMTGPKGLMVHSADLVVLTGELPPPLGDLLTDDRWLPARLVVAVDDVPVFRGTVRVGWLGTIGPGQTGLVMMVVGAFEMAEAHKSPPIAKTQDIIN